MQPVDDVAFATSLQHFTERFQHAAIEYPNAHDDTRQQRLSRVELDLIRAKRQHSNRFGFAVLLLHFKSHGRFPRTAFELEPGLVADVLAQLDIETVPMVLTERTAERHRAEIRALLGFREATVADGEVLLIVS